MISDCIDVVQKKEHYMIKDHYLTPSWSAPTQVRAVVTTRQHGHSVAPYDSFNLADHVGDSPRDVQDNRLQLVEELHLPAEPLWLDQQHGNVVINAATSDPWPDADAAFTTEHEVVCAVLTADCLPILLCNRKGTQVAAIHAGWRGLAAGIIPATLAQLSQDGGEWLAWLGPAISSKAFTVGEDVFNAFADTQTQQAFVQQAPGQWQCDMYAIAKQQLLAGGVGEISGGNYCTYTDSQLFFSYRRAQYTGRMASLIWLTGA